MSWIDNGPVSTPPRAVVYAAAGVLVVAALGGVGLGLQSGWRDTGRPEIGSVDDTLSADQAAPARPIVDIQSVEQQAPAPVAAPTNAAAADNQEADSNDIAAKTAEAQAVQSKPSQSSQSIDEILASPSEKPQAPAKPSTDESAPGAPTGKNDVPF